LESGLILESSVAQASGQYPFVPPQVATIKVSNQSQVRAFRTDIDGKSAFFMKPRDLTPRTGLKPASIGLPTSQLPIVPFKAWSPPGMKTGLRNQRIGRKISLVPFRAIETDKAPTELAKHSEIVTIPSKR
jgi:hypothetical protein